MIGVEKEEPIEVLVMLTVNWVTIKNPLSTMRNVKIAIEIGYRGGEGRAYENLGDAYSSLGDYQRSIEYDEKHLKIAIEIGDRGGEGRAYGNLGVS